jgi:gluconate kinase
MATKRDAVSTIRGYFYQFDYSIIKVLTLEKETDTICIEGIEDVDINDENNITLHQCKCYEGTEYSHSEIKKAVQWMLKHFAQNRDSCYKYYLYGVYKSGQDKLPNPLTVDFAKKYFFTTRHNNGSIDRLYDELSLNDDALSEFLNKLIININAESYSKQEQTVRETICSSLECRAQDVELYYCNALSIIKKLAAEKNPSDRTISRAEFIRQIRTVDDQFELWLLHKKGKDKFAKAIKKNFFSNGVNISPYNRFFIIECNKNTSIVDLKTIILLISKKYSKLTNHAKPKFCPYFCFYGLNEDKLIELKR